MVRRLALSCFLLVIAAADARAEPITVLPDGNVVFNDVGIETQGVFSCPRAFTACSGSGTNSVTLGTGANRATLTFTGKTQSIDIANFVKPVTLGTFETSGPANFTFPQRTNVNNPVLFFSLIVTESSPTQATTRTGWSFGPGGGTELRVLSGIDHFGLPIGPNPFKYDTFVFTTRPFPFSLPGHGTRDFVADVGAVPEPGTLILVGSGLAGAALARRRRSRGGPIV
jgi:PEP-CTERM motif